MCCHTYVLRLLLLAQTEIRTALPQVARFLFMMVSVGSCGTPLSVVDETA